jgi:hypothetical protein
MTQGTFDVITSSETVFVDPPSNLILSGNRHSITVEWSAGANNVKYKVERKINGESYSTMNDNYASTSLIQDNLKAGTTYWYRVSGYDAENELSDYVESSCMTMAVTVLSKDIDETAGTPKVFEINIEKDTFLEDCYVDVTSTNSAKINTATEKDNDILTNVAGSVKQIIAKNLFGASIEESGFSKEVELRIYYVDEEIEGIAEDTLKIYVLNVEKNEWDKVGGEVNADENYVSAEVGHFSVYCLMGESTDTTFQIQDITNYPNPFSDGTVFTFRLTKSADVKLEIYTSAGRLIKKYDAVPMDAGYNEIPEGSTWDGGDLSNGLYLYKITATDNDGNTVNKTAKLVLMR